MRELHQRNPSTGGVGKTRLAVEIAARLMTELAA
jgi:hypothetical protein